MPIQRVLTRVLPLLLCFFCSASWADAAAELEELIQNKQWTAAQQRLQSAIQQNPKSAESPQWRLMSSQILAGQGQPQEAIVKLQALIQEFPELPEPYNNLGVLLAAQGQLEEAVAALKLAVHARPNYKVALQNLGDLYTALAQQAYREAKNVSNGNGQLPLPPPAAETTTSTNTRTLR
jgi:tetratricopeptide (TPR) repeat protein